jgi:signal peptidase I
MTCIELIKTRRRILLWSLVITILFYLLFEAFSAYFTFAYTVKGQECFHYRFWLIRKGVIPQKGEYVYFRNPRSRSRWVKMIYGVEGDRIEVRRISERKSFKIFLHEIEKPLTLQGYVILHGRETLPFRVFEGFERDTKGKPLSLIEGGIIPKGKYFVVADSVRSFDSRYWGLLDEKEILGKAYPIF